jgi:hypothetical protein
MWTVVAGRPAAGTTDGSKPADQRRRIDADSFAWALLDEQSRAAEVFVLEPQIGRGFGELRALLLPRSSADDLPAAQAACDSDTRCEYRVRHAGGELTVVIDLSDGQWLRLVASGEAIRVVPRVLQIDAAASANLTATADGRFMGRKSVYLQPEPQARSAQRLPDAAFRLDALDQVGARSR